MHFPKTRSELLMFPASFSLSPKVLVLLHLSEPAKSHRENLRTANFVLLWPIAATSCDDDFISDQLNFFVGELEKIYSRTYNVLKLTLTSFALCFHPSSAVSW